MKNIQTYTLLLQKRILGFYYILNENCNCSIFTYISQCSIFHFNVFFFSASGVKNVTNVFHLQK